MKISLESRRQQGLTPIEVLVIIAVVAIFVLMLDIPGFNNAKAHALRIQCLNNLNQTGLADRIWEGDHGNLYPQAAWETNGGTMEFTSGPNAFRHFQIMSNELSTPKVLLCPADDDRFIAATNFININNSNLSFFVGIVSNDNNPSLILSGDHNITNGTKIRNGLLELTTNNPSRWTTEMHDKVGNILLADGSVQQVSISGLRGAVANTGVPTNRIQMPILGP
jgi:prepilin-type processing-associated H-X9-DG protein